jgi:phytoene dehydrogenase-like protein
MKKIIIIGGGVSGLSIGCYAQMNGYQSEIYEMHSIPGGVCTSWKRGDYLFDHCLHWVLGSNHGTQLYPVFKELGIAGEIEFYNTARFRKICMNGKEITVYTDIEKFEQELFNIFPMKKIKIRSFFKLVKFYTKFNPPVDGDFGKFGIIGFLKMLPYVPSFLKLKNISFKSFLLSHFKDTDLAEILFQMFPVAELPAIIPVMSLAFFNNKEGGYPLGGSLNFSNALAKKYQELGGRLICNSKVMKIAIENDCATGIVFENGSIVSGDIIVSACDGRTTLFSMLPQKYMHPKLYQLYRNPVLWPPLICISLGVNRDVSELVELNNIHLKTPCMVGGKEVAWFYFSHYCHDKNFAPKGKSVITIQIESDYTYWENLYNNKVNYTEEKCRIFNWAIDQLEQQLPGIRNQIEISDIATPISWVKYTGNWQGSYEGWLPTVKSFGKTIPKTLPNLRNFWMTGQWVIPGGGIPMCMVQGKNIMRKIIKCDKDRNHRNIYNTKEL